MVSNVRNGAAERSYNVCRGSVPSVHCRVWRSLIQWFPGYRDDRFRWNLAAKGEVEYHHQDAMAFLDGQRGDHT